MVSFFYGQSKPNDLNIPLISILPLKLTNLVKLMFNIAVLDQVGNAYRNDGISVRTKR